jgi:hypothetical protein
LVKVYDLGVVPSSRFKVTIGMRLEARVRKGSGAVPVVPNVPIVSMVSEWDRIYPQNDMLSLENTIFWNENPKTA